MVVGFFLRKKGYLADSTVIAIDTLVYHVFLPCMLFNSIYSNRLAQAVDRRLFLFSTISILLLFCLLYLLVPFITKDNRKRGALAHGIFRANTLIFGTPLAMSLLGPAETARVLLTLGLLISLTNVLGLSYLEIFKGERFNLKRTVVNLATNPIITSILLALVAGLFPFSIPVVVLTSIRYLGDVTSPLAFIVLGATFTLAASRKDRREIIIAVVLKTMLIPLVLVIGLGGFFMQFRGYELVVLLCLFATPTAVSTCPAAKKMESDGVLAGELVVFTTACSIFTLFIFILLLKQLCFL